jgi:hypothetical protein
MRKAHDLNRGRGDFGSALDIAFLQAYMLSSMAQWQREQGSVIHTYPPWKVGGYLTPFGHTTLNAFHEDAVFLERPSTLHKASR